MAAWAVSVPFKNVCKGWIQFDHRNVPEYCHVQVCTTYLHSEPLQICSEWWCELIKLVANIVRLCVCVYNYVADWQMSRHFVTHKDMSLNTGICGLILCRHNGPFCHQVLTVGTMSHTVGECYPLLILNCWLSHRCTCFTKVCSFATLSKVRVTGKNFTEDLINATTVLYKRAVYRNVQKMLWNNVKRQLDATR